MSTVGVYAELLFPFQCLAHFIRKIIHRERFLQEVKAFIQHVMMSDDIGHIAGSKKDISAPV